MIAEAGRALEQFRCMMLAIVAQCARFSCSLSARFGRRPSSRTRCAMRMVFSRRPTHRTCARDCESRREVCAQCARFWQDIRRAMHAHVVSYAQCCPANLVCARDFQCAALLHPSGMRKLPPMRNHFFSPMRRVHAQPHAQFRTSFGTLNNSEHLIIRNTKF